MKKVGVTFLVHKRRIIMFFFVLQNLLLIVGQLTYKKNSGRLLWNHTTKVISKLHRKCVQKNLRYKYVQAKLTELVWEWWFSLLSFWGGSRNMFLAQLVFSFTPLRLKAVVTGFVLASTWEEVSFEKPWLGNPGNFLGQRAWSNQNLKYCISGSYSKPVRKKAPSVSLLQG